MSRGMRRVEGESRDRWSMLAVGAVLVTGLVAFSCSDSPTGAPEADGMSGSELGHQLFSKFIEKKRSYLEHLSKAFGAQQNSKNSQN